MNNNYQDINNEVNDSYSSIVTMKYYVEPYNDSKWIHRDIEYNNAGIPIIRLYVGETKKIYKMAFINGVDNNLNIIVPNTTFINDVENRIYSGYGQEDYVILKGDAIGTAYLSTTITGKLNTLYTNIIDNDVLIIVEKEPTIMGLKWGHENPLILNSLDKVTISLKIIYDNNQESEISITDLEHLSFISSNPHCAIISSRFESGILFPGGTFNRFIAHEISPYNLDDRCQIKITDSSLKETFGEDFKNIEPLTIITHKNINPELILNANFKVEYEKEIPLLDITNTYNITIYGIYELSNGRVIRYNIDDVYKFTSLDESIVKTNSKNNTLSPISLGTTQVIGYCSEVNDEFTTIPKEITWDIRIIKTLQSINWSIDKKELNIGIDYATISVIATYTDNSIEDISNSCSFKYNDNYIKVEGNKVIPIAPGNTDISILSSFETGNINSDMTYTLTIVQPMEDIDIVDIEKVVLDETELELYVGDEKDLGYTIYPKNATPQTMIWNSTDDSVVSVDKFGHIKVLKEGYARIFVGVKSKETEISEDNDASDENIESLYSSIYAVCSINAYAIKVTNIKLSHDEVTIYVGDKDFYYDVTIEPEKASNKEVKISFISDIRGWPVTVGTSDYFLSGIKEGTGTLKITSVDNPEVYAEMKVTVIDNRVKKVIINNGNDSDYEWYDDFVNSPEVEAYKGYTTKKFSEKTYTIDKIKEHERWDDDDFPRYYCPINNSLQLSASIEPSGASFADLIWYSSDGELVKCTEDGIITPVRYGKQKLDMDANDASNDEGRRFPNTTWITAFNRKSMKSGVCQVRVTRNNITAINIGEVTEHDYDEDIFDSDGSLNVPTTHEYRRDYIIWRGETKIMPVTLSVQDPNFGPSNNIEWIGHTEVGGADWDDIVEFSGEYVSHKNRDDEFDWSSNSPAQINSDKKNLDVELKGVGLGKVYFYARCSDPYWASTETASDTTDEDGNAHVGNYDISVAYYGTSGKTYIAKAVSNATVILNSANQIIVTTPAIYYKKDDGTELEFFVNKKYTNNCNRVEVKVSKDGSPVKDVMIFITSYRSASKLNEIVDKTNDNGYAINPSPNADEYGNTQISSYIGDMARPGQGEYKNVEDSRRIRVTVVDAPSNIYLTFKSMSRVITRGLPMHNLASVWTPNTRVKIKYSSTRCVPCFIYFDDEFVDLLNDYADGDECPLDDKYMSFAWFTSDPNVFIPIERSQVQDERDAPEIQEMFGGTTLKEDGTYTIRKKEYNLKGYGRYMCIQPTGRGKAKLTIVNIMSGKSWERLIEVE